jgi:hypothetical protein
MIFKCWVRTLGILLGMLCLVMSFGGTASAASASYTAPSLPWATALNICFGGQLCGLNDTVTVNVPTNSFIGYVQVRAHDNVGDKHSATLRLYVDGTLMGSQDVKQAGSILVYPLQVLGSQIVFRSVREGSSSGDETVLTEIQVWDRCYGYNCGAP